MCLTSLLSGDIRLLDFIPLQLNPVNHLNTNEQRHQFNNCCKMYVGDNYTDFKVSVYGCPLNANVMFANMIETCLWAKEKEQSINLVQRLYKFNQEQAQKKPEYP